MADRFELLNLIGSGTFGSAWLAKNKTDNSKCVVKIIKILKLPEKELDQALNEVAILARCKQTNIINYQDAFIAEGSLNIVMEYADGGDLHKKIQEQDKKGVSFEKEVILDWFVQMCFALKYIHSQNILHRDLKTQNVFLTSENVVKLGDFGIARILRDSGDHASTTIGTPFYLSPEICQRKPYNHKSDMWALGCVLYEMCAFHVPFNASDFDSLLFQIMSGEFEPLPSYFGTTISYLCGKLLNTDPNERLSATEVLNWSPLKVFVQKYITGNKKMPRPLSIRNSNKTELKEPKESKSKRRSSISSGSDKCKKDIGVNDVSKLPVKSGAVKEKRPLNPLNQIQGRDSFLRRPSIRAECTKRKDIKWLSDKENIDPRQLIGDRTYKVKNPRFHRLSSATPRISRILSNQKSSISQAQEKSQPRKDSIERSVLTRNIGRQKCTSVPTYQRKETEGSETGSVEDEVFSESSFDQVFDEDTQEPSIITVRRASIESSKPTSDLFLKEQKRLQKKKRISVGSSRRESIEHFRTYLIKSEDGDKRVDLKSSVKDICNDVSKEIAPDDTNKRRISLSNKDQITEKEKITDSKNKRRISLSNKEQISEKEINSDSKNKRRISLSNKEQIIEKEKNTDAKNKRRISLSNKEQRPEVEKITDMRSQRKISVSDGCLYKGQSEERNCVRRSNSYDVLSKDQKAEKRTRGSGSETYLVSQSGSNSKVASTNDCKTRNKEMMDCINKALYMSLQDFIHTPSKAKDKTYQRLVEMFGEESLDNIIEVSRECLYNENSYDFFHVMLPETDLAVLPLIFQYLQFECTE